MRRILVTGSGGIGGVNFCRALRSAGEYFIVGTDYFRYHLVFPEVDVRIRTPKHSDEGFIPRIREVVDKYGIEFVHPQPTVEAYEISKHRGEINAAVFLPAPEAIERGFDKLETAAILERGGVPVPRTLTFPPEDDIPMPAWVRVRRGAGGRLSILCRSVEEVYDWINLWNRRGATRGEDWMIQEYIGGRDVAWDSLWFEGRLVTSYTRERLEYPFRHLHTGAGGTPTVARIIRSEEVNRVCARAVLALDDRPHGFYCVDLKLAEKPYITEINVGKAHTTLALWSYAMHKFLGKVNIPDLYVRLGLGEEVPPVPRFDLYPEGYYLIRHIDCGSWLWREDGWKVRVV